MINPVDCRKASEEKPETLEDNFDVPSEVSTIEGFTTMSESELSSLRVDMGLAMSDADIIFTQKHFIEEKREPTVTEIRVLDTYWSDHCRHTTFLTELTDIKFEGDDALTQEIKATFDDYILSRKDLYADRLSSKRICLMDLATPAMKKLKRDGKLADLDESEEINACSIKI